MMTCAWEPDPACLGDKWAALSPEVQERSIMLATSSLIDLTNNRVGTCPITIRPCPEPRRCGCGWNPHVRSDGFGGSVWVNDCACQSTCAPLSEIDLPGPVGYIDLFLIDGQPVDLESGDWRLDNGHLLVWQGAGPSPIPSTQDLDKADTGPNSAGTYSITYSRSYPVGPDARLAMTYLAMEFAEACKPKGKCSLPRGVTQVVRSGVSFSIEAGLFPNGRTGIDIVDTFITKWAPYGRQATAQVFDPAKAAPRRTSGVPLRSPLGSI